MRSPTLLSLMLFSACSGSEPAEAEYVPVPLKAGAPKAGVASGYLRLPAGVPLGGYTSRDAAFGGSRTRPRDLRQTPWAHKFHPSAGQLTGIPLQALWLSNGDRELVVLRIDLIGAFDNIVHEVSRRLSSILGRDMSGQVVMVTSHSHSSPAAHMQSLQFALGFDRYDPRVFERIVEQGVTQALAAHSALAPARIGFGRMPQADPNGPDQLWRDRRSENDHLLDMDGEVIGPGSKDTEAQVLKVEDADGELMAVLLNVGLHGILFGDDNVWTHWDAPGSIAYGLSAALGGKPVFLLQGGGGDVSPAGQGETAYAKCDDMARRAGARLAPFVEAVATAADPVLLEASSMTMTLAHQGIVVSRRGSANFHYTPVTLDEYGEPEQAPDNVVFDGEGRVIEAIDEFPALQGAGLCGEAVGVPFGSLGLGFASSTQYPYDRCALLEKLMPILAGRYEVELSTALASTPEGPRNVEPAMNNSLVGFTQIDGLPVTVYDGGEATVSRGRVGMMFLPGETTTLLTLRAKRYMSDLGYEAGMVVGYAMDHEGYLMTIEDWLQGGYEPSINVWGPLQGEYLLEGALSLAERGLKDERIRTDDIGAPTPDYAGAPLGFELPADPVAASPGAGTVPAELPEGGVLLPLNIDPELVDARATEARVQAISGVYAGTFEGGDVAIDSPVVTLQRLVDGAFEDQRGTGNWFVNSDGSGLLLGYTPTPLRDLDAPRRHLWTVVWQAVGEGIGAADWAMILPGTYRFIARGRAVMSEGTEPSDYEVALPSFEVVPTTITVGEDGIARYRAGEAAFRGLGINRQPRDAAALPEGMMLRLTCLRDDAVSHEADVPVGVGGSVELVLPGDGSTCSLVDPYGNAASL